VQNFELISDMTTQSVFT